jgi:hypothetical protein
LTPRHDVAHHRRHNIKGSLPGGCKMTHTTALGQKWKPTPYTGIQMCGLRQNEQGGGNGIRVIE